jgi:hypothetical protein
MRSFVLVGKAKTVFRTIEIAAKRATMSLCPYQENMKCSNSMKYGPPENCWDCPIRQKKVSTVLRAQASIEKLTAVLPARTQILSPEYIAVKLVICPKASECNSTQCAHRVPHRPYDFAYKGDCSTEDTLCPDFTVRCEIAK